MIINKIKVLKGFIFFIIGLLSPLMIVLIRMKLFNPFLLLIISIPLLIYLKIYNYRKRKNNEKKEFVNFALK